MADRIADNADLILDETKRKARRRLVGAIVLALAAAIILPMLLEKEPRPLGDDVSVRIPPVDESKFINKLTGKSTDTKPLPKADDKADSRSAAKPDPIAAPGGAASPASPPAPPAASEAAAPKKAAADEPRANVPAAAPASGSATGAKGAAKEAIADARPAPVETSAPGAESKPAPAEPKPTAAESKSASAEPKSTSAASKPITSAAPAPAASPAKPEGFVVQLAAYADDKGANSLANKLKRAGYAAFVEAVQTSRGTLWRVRVGGYGTRPEAEAARVKLKGEGFSGIVQPAS